VLHFWLLQYEECLAEFSHGHDVIVEIHPLDSVVSGNIGKSIYGTRPSRPIAFFAGLLNEYSTASAFEVERSIKSR
jgi:hypothetical protein